MWAAGYGSEAPKHEKRMTKKHTREIPQGTVPSHENRSTHSEDGVDLTLIRWMLSLTPAERLQVLQQTIRSLMKKRGGTND